MKLSQPIQSCGQGPISSFIAFQLDEKAPDDVINPRTSKADDDENDDASDDSSSSSCSISDESSTTSDRPSLRKLSLTFPHQPGPCKLRQPDTRQLSRSSRERDRVSEQGIRAKSTQNGTVLLTGDDTETRSRVASCCNAADIPAGEDNMRREELGKLREESTSDKRKGVFQKLQPKHHPPEPGKFENLGLGEQIDQLITIIIKADEEKDVPTIINTCGRLVPKLPRPYGKEKQVELVSIAQKLIKMMKQIQCNERSLAAILIVLPHILLLVVEVPQLEIKLEVLDEVVELVRHVLFTLHQRDEYKPAIRRALDFVVTDCENFFAIQQQLRRQFHADDKRLLLRFLVCDALTKLTRCELIFKLHERAETAEAELERFVKELQVMTYEHQRVLADKHVTGKSLFLFAEFHVESRWEKKETISTIESWYLRAIACFKRADDWQSESEQERVIDDAEYALARFYAGNFSTKDGNRFQSDLLSRTPIGFGGLANDIKILLTLLVKKTPAAAVHTQRDHILTLVLAFKRNLDQVQFMAEDLKTSADYKRLYTATQYAPDVAISLAHAYYCYHEAADFMKSCFRMIEMIPDADMRVVGLQVCWRRYTSYACHPDTTGSVGINKVLCDAVYQHMSNRDVINPIENITGSDKNLRACNMAKYARHSVRFLLSCGDMKYGEKVARSAITQLQQAFNKKPVLKSYVGQLYTQAADMAQRQSSIPGSMRARQHMDKALFILHHADDWFDDDEKQEAIEEFQRMKTAAGKI